VSAFAPCARATASRFIRDGLAGLDDEILTPRPQLLELAVEAPAERRHHAQAPLGKP
jgi:hypothetical protein